MTPRTCLQYLSRLLSRRSGPRQRRRSVDLNVEALEERALLAITWVNRLAASDTFTAAERAVVDQAVSFWNRIILDFDSDANNAAHTFNVTITGGSSSGINLGGNILGVTDTYRENNSGIPTSARVRIDADAGGNANGWYIDPNPSDHAEFGNPITPFRAGGGPVGQDRYSTLLHEPGHAVGFTVNYANLTAYLTTNADGTRTFTGAGGLTAPLVSAANGTHLSSAAHPNDLLNMSLNGGVRNLPSDLDVQILADAFDYWVALPSTVQTFLANLNTQTSTLAVNANPLDASSNFTLQRSGADLLVTVNGITNSIPLASINRINVNTASAVDLLTVNDRSSPVGDWYSLTRTELMSFFLPRINYGNVAGFTLQASNQDSLRQRPPGPAADSQRVDR